ncbi:hypothetical protein [Halioxenophilus sp. WMMB6]|uniref:hypothetical protein n=1 Tax=Halioxenophilus sp. WMMB6 TaxID=3073815 RepID=UPI00295F024B|nr:hypothetical protein [Halioxenophilus sp. WMMB6]
MLPTCLAALQGDQITVPATEGAGERRCVIIVAGLQRRMASLAAQLARSVQWQFGEKFFRTVSLDHRLANTYLRLRSW